MAAKVELQGPYRCIADQEACLIVAISPDTASGVREFRSTDDRSGEAGNPVSVCSFGFCMRRYACERQRLPRPAAGCARAQVGRALRGLHTELLTLPTAPSPTTTHLMDVRAAILSRVPCCPDYRIPACWRRVRASYRDR